ncbi:methyl-accepting chemotaxis protein [Syntrophomonas erecta]
MKIIHNIKTMPKLVAAFALVALMIVIGGISTLNNMNHINQAMFTIYHDHLLPQSSLLSIADSMGFIRADLWQSIYREDSRSHSLKSIKTRLNLIERSLNEYDQAHLQKQEKEIYQKFSSNFDLYSNSLRKIITLVEEGQNEAAVAVIESDLVYKGQAARDSLNLLIEIQHQGAEKASREGTNLYHTSRDQTLIITVLAFLLAIFLGIVLARHIALPLVAAAEHAGRLAAGDFTGQIPACLRNRRDEIGMLGLSFEDMGLNLKERIKNTLSEINDNSQQVNELSKQLNEQGENISQTLGYISEATEEIATRMEEISYSSNRMSASGEQIANALSRVKEQADENQVQAQNIADRAVKLQSNAHSSQDEAINMYSRIRSELLKAIDNTRAIENISVLAQDIAAVARQTNLLSLNAAVEAARAGDQGHGFAVVAGEVGKLARDSAATVVNIQKLADQAQSALADLMEYSQALLNFINDRVITDYDFMVDMGEHYQKDSNLIIGLTETVNAYTLQVMQAMEEMNQAIQTTAANITDATARTQEIASASESANRVAMEIHSASSTLNEGSEKLHCIIKNFKV